MGLTAAEKITKAKAGLILDQPFFGSLVLRLGMKECPYIPTAMVNGVDIRYNPDWVDTMTLEQTKGLLAHEVMHCALKHHVRRQGREPGKWNWACDYAIHPLLEKSGFVLPEGAHIKPEYYDMSADKQKNY